MHLTILAAAGSFGDMIKDTADTFGWNLQLFLSQVISFVIVAVLLRRFAYKPILNVLHERRERIAEALRNADKIKQQLAEAEKRHAENLAKANAEAQRMIEEARESAYTWRSAEQEAIAAAEQIIAKAREAQHARARTLHGGVET
jgi:F-type H+-transporting ATPase subunit b